MNATFFYFNTGLKEIPTIQCASLFYEGDMSNVHIQTREGQTRLHIKAPEINYCIINARMIHPKDLHTYADPTVFENISIITFSIKGYSYSYAIGVCHEDLGMILEDRIKPIVQRFIDSDYEIDPDDLIDKTMGEYLDSLFSY